MGGRAATYGPVRRPAVPGPGSTTRACTSSWALSDTRRQRNQFQKTVGELYAEKSHVRIERRMAKRARKSTAPLTANGGPSLRGAPRRLLPPAPRRSPPRRTCSSASMNPSRRWCQRRRASTTPYVRGSNVVTGSTCQTHGEGAHLGIGRKTRPALVTYWPSTPGNNVWHPFKRRTSRGSPPLR